MQELSEITNPRIYELTAEIQGNAQPILESKNH